MCSPKHSQNNRFFFITNKKFHQKFLPSDSGPNSEIWNCPGSLTNVKFHRSIKVFEGDLNLEKYV